MAIKYESVVPWGRSYDEYVDMFHLTDVDLDKSILGCGDGPASFNTLMNKKGKRVVSIDPIYRFTAREIEKRIEETYQNVINQTRNNRDKFVWTKIKNIEELGAKRMAAMKEFLADFEKGKIEKRYVYGELPVLPFANRQFELALSSHFLFLYTANLSLEFHLAAIDEMLRVAGEVRIFPLLDVNAAKSSYVAAVIKRYQEPKYLTEVVKVDYEFQKGGHEMLRIVALFRMDAPRDGQNTTPGSSQIMIDR